MFNWTITDTKQYLELSNFVDLCLQITYLICVNKPNLALNNLQWLICNKNKPNPNPDINYFVYE